VCDIADLTDSKSPLSSSYTWRSYSNTNTFLCGSQYPVNFSSSITLNEYSGTSYDGKIITRTLYSPPGFAAASMVQVRFQASDIQSSVTATSTTSAVNTTSTGSAAVTTVISQGHGLSTGAKSGIGAAVGVLGLALLAALAVLAIWCRRSRRQIKAGEVVLNHSSVGIGSIGVTHVGVDQKQELDGQPSPNLHELEGKSPSK
jgi:hypothetical protein